MTRMLGCYFYFFRVPLTALEIWAVGEKAYIKSYTHDIAWVSFSHTCFEITISLVSRKKSWHSALRQKGALWGSMPNSDTEVQGLV